MTDELATLIERLKNEIYEKAILMGVPFDHEDIEAHEILPGHWLVALMWIKTPLVVEDDPLTHRVGKMRNVGLSKPPRQLCRFEPTDDPFTYTIHCYVPRVIVQNPFLVCLVHADGTYESGADKFADWFDAEAKSQTREDMEWAIRTVRERLKY